MAEQLIAFDVSRQVVEEMFSAVEDPSTHEWTVTELKNLVVVSSLRNAPKRFVDMLAMALKSLPLERLNWFLDNYVVDSNVLTRMNDDDLVWPGLSVVGSWPDSDGYDLDLYKSRMDRQLVDYAEMASARVMKKGHRVTISYTRKVDQAVAYINSGSIVTSEESGAEYAYVAALAVARGVTMLEAANIIVNKGSPWIQADAAIERVREEFQIAIESMTTQDEVKTAYTASTQEIDIIINTLLGIPNEVEDE